MSSTLRIAVTGLAATYPLGGVFWDYIQYPLGLLRLGHDVLYIEDTGQWSYQPRQRTFTPDGSDNARYLNREIKQIAPDLVDRWYFRDALDQTFGRTPEEVARFCQSADLFLHLSGTCLMREEYFAARTVVLIDSDPMFTQALGSARVANDQPEDFRARLDALHRHDVFFTFGENVGGEDCLIPRDGIDWLPTRQPVVRDVFEGHEIPVDERRPVLTTVLSWSPYEKAPTINGVPCHGKPREFERFQTLPGRVDVPLELAISGQAPIERLASLGWRIRDARAISASPGAYREYLARSTGEWSIAKHAYVASRSGWFSCRSACYLALGVPAIVQDTGFSGILPAGDGILAFSNMDEAVSAIESVQHDPVRHSRAAREIALEHFDSDRVLTRLIEQATSTGFQNSSEDSHRDARFSSQSRLS